MEKKCSDCEEIKPLDYFYSRSKKERYKSEAASRSGYCKECTRGHTATWAKKTYRKRYDSNPEKFRLYQMKARYGMSPDHYRAFVSQRSNCCDICGVNGGDKNLQVDHNHITNEVRGLLCPVCNKALGMFKVDANTEILEKAFQYLNKSKLQLVGDI